MAASASARPEGITDPNYQPPPGRLGNLSVPQQHALEKLRKEMKDEGRFVPERMDDTTLLRCVWVRFKGGDGTREFFLVTDCIVGVGF